MQRFVEHYHQERYLFDVVSPRFQREHELSAFDFFCIVIWKANRAKSKIAKRLLRNSDHFMRTAQLVGTIGSISTPSACRIVTQPPSAPSRGQLAPPSARITASAAIVERAPIALWNSAWPSVPKPTQRCRVRNETPRTAASPLNDAQKAKMDWVRHPLVRTHPHTGRKSLYAVSGSSFGIEGMGDNEGRALLDDLKGQATAEKYRSTPKYRPGDVIIWDNCALLHSAPLVDPREPRTLWRITVKEQGPTL